MRGIAGEFYELIVDGISLKPRMRAKVLPWPDHPDYELAVYSSRVEQRLAHQRSLQAFGVTTLEHDRHPVVVGGPRPWGPGKTNPVDRAGSRGSAYMA